MKSVVKVLTGNEHAGAAMSSELLIDGIMAKKVDFLDFRIVMLCHGDFAKKIKEKYPLHTEVINSSAPPIISHSIFLMRVLNRIRLLVWFIISTIRLSINLHGRKMDIIHTTNNYALIVCSFYRMFHRVKLITHWRCIGGVRTKLYKYITGVVDEIFCISESVKESLPLIWHSKCITIYDGIEVGILREKGERNRGLLRSYLNIVADMPLFGTVGSYTEIKCHDLLIESCYLIHREHPDLRFKCALIGSSPNLAAETYLQELKRKVTDYKLLDFIDFVPDTAIAAPSTIIIDFDFFVGSTWLEGRGEGFGLMYVEAMAQTLPMIAIGVGAARELITSETGILINNNSVIEHSKYIRLMITNDYRKRFNSETIFQHAFKYDISKTIENVIENYQCNLKFNT